MRQPSKETSPCRSDPVPGTSRSWRQFPWHARNSLCVSFRIAPRFIEGPWGGPWVDPMASSSVLSMNVESPSIAPPSTRSVVSPVGGRSLRHGAFRSLRARGVAATFAGCGAPNFHGFVGVSRPSTGSASTWELAHGLHLRKETCAFLSHERCPHMMPPQLELLGLRTPRELVTALESILGRFFGPLPARVRAALLAVDRAQFVRECDREFAYENIPLPLDTTDAIAPSFRSLLDAQGRFDLGRGSLLGMSGATISQPGAYALAFVLLSLQEGHRYLELGTGTGYGAVPRGPRRGAARPSDDTSSVLTRRSSSKPSSSTRSAGNGCRHSCRWPVGC